MKKFATFLAFQLLSGALFAQFSPDTVFTKVEQMPYFHGCETFEPDTDSKRRCSDRAMVKFISTYLVYPETAKAQGIEGIVYVSFIVDEKGQVSQPQLLTDIGGGCGVEALKIIGEMPVWEPGEQHGQTVRVRLNLPVQFSLRTLLPEENAGYHLSWGRLTNDVVSVEELLENLEQPVYVRDPEGNNRYVDELAFTFEKNKKLVNATSRGVISEDLVKVVEKCRKGGSFTITASVQDKGRFLYLSRTYQVAGSK